MEQIVKLLTLALCLGAISAKAVEEDYSRTLRALQDMAKDTQEKRDLIECKAYKEDCTGIIRCCGTMQCYWEKGYSAINKGVCVNCVSEGQACQRDSQCCSDLQCEKGNFMWLDGTCQKYRRSGECYRDGQCVNECKKKWYQTHGTCE